MTDIGPYRIEKQIGRSTYIANRADGHFDQRVVLDTTGSYPTLIHPNIVRVLDAREHYAVLEYVDGTPADQHASKLPLKERLRLFTRVCAAVEHAHQHATAHGDIKPSNVLITESGLPVLVGFAHGSDSESDLRGLQLLMRAMLQGVSDPELEAIALKPGYASVAMLSEDVERYLSNRTVQAYGDHISYRLRKFAARNQTWVLVTGAVAITSFFAVAGALQQYQEVRAETARAEERFRDVRSLTNSLLFELHDVISGLEGSEKAERILAVRAEEHLDNLRAEMRPDELFMLDWVDSKLRIAAIHNKIGNSEAMHRTLAGARDAATNAGREWRWQRGMVLFRLCAALSDAGQDASPFAREAVEIVEEYARRRDATKPTLEQAARVLSEIRPDRFRNAAAAQEFRTRAR